MQQCRRTKGDYPKNATRARVAACSLVITLLFVPRLAWGQVGSDRFSSIVIEASSGRVLSAIDPDAERYPASLTKMMTLYLAFEAIRDHRISDDELVPISPHAASQVPSKLGLVPGSRITVRQAMLGLVTRSANDAASALGELMGGTEEHFAEMMTLRAHALGMSHTRFRNASGLPDPDQVTTADDLALLARHLVQDFPDQYRLFSTPSFFWHGQMIANHDNLLKSYPGADGIKTGYTDAAGHNLVTSAVRDNVRLIGVVLGANTNPERDARMAAMLDDGYSQLNIAPPAALTLATREARPVHRFAGLIGSAEAATLPDPSVRPFSPGGSYLQGSDWSIRDWAIQVGSYSSNRMAEHAAILAARGTRGDAHVERTTFRGRITYRAQVVSLHREDAYSYCRHHAICTVIPPLDRLASR